MTLLPNWPTVLRRAWSVRLIAASLAADCAGISLAVMGAIGVYDSPWRAVGLQVLGAMFNLGAFMARLTYQRGVSGVANGN